MKVENLMNLLQSFPSDCEIEIRFFETNTGEYIDSTSAIGIIEENSLIPILSVDIEAEKLRRFLK